MTTVIDFSTGTNKAAAWGRERVVDAEIRTL